MTDPDSSEAEPTRRRARAALETRGHTWRTAAIMTCLLAPLGWIFGVAGLLLLRGIAERVEREPQSAEQRLRVARLLVVIGTAVGALSMLGASFRVVRLVLEMPRIEQHRSVRSFEAEP